MQLHFLHDFQSEIFYNAGKLRSLFNTFLKGFTIQRI